MVPHKRGAEENEIKAERGLPDCETTKGRFLELTMMKTDHFKSAPNVTRVIYASGVSSQTQVPTVRVPWLARHFPAPEDQREYARERCVVAITEALGEAMESAGLTRAAVAERLGKTRGHVSKVLKGAHNMTLRTLGELLWACDKEIRDLELAELGVVNVAREDIKAWHPFTISADDLQAQPAGPILTERAVAA
ncbi:MAG: helix-turn-helix domain-containing protein [Gemmatimonadaceae bacterium]